MNFGAGGTGSFWAARIERGGRCNQPTSSASDIEYRLVEAEERLMVTMEWVEALVARVAVLEARLDA